MPRWRRPSRQNYVRRYNVYRRWIAEDIAELLAYRVPLNSDVGQELLRIMEERVREAAELEPDLPLEEVIDNVTTEAISDVESGLIDEESEWALYYLVSP